ncbi:hypothetical protein [Nocardioides renjunii]|uniref:hypothetical protein n=1 Tax=Nocardioides renjunii TaxID=3095075 RepID=UPI002AFE3C66|nr:hypothetical protein [Nocardioides sp. S-34]WQQ20340.1 hypothetical protein SHK17_10490 [Nocardioides sp. S-34]
MRGDEVVAMTRMLIRVDGTVSDELVSAFPQLSARAQRTETTLVGDVIDQEELQGVLNLLSTLGIRVVEVLTIPSD